MPRGAREPWPPPRAGLTRWWRDHKRVAAESFGFTSQRIGTSLLVWLLLGIALALPAGLWLIRANLDAATADWEGRPGLTVYMQRTATDAATEAVAAALAGQDRVDSVHTTTSEQALEEFRAHGQFGEALDLMPENPLPGSVRAILNRGADADDLRAIAGAVEDMPGVAEVVVEETWMERVQDVSRLLFRLGVLLAVLFGVGAVLVTSTTVRLAIESRLEEMRVLKLVGATDAQLRRPLLYFGAFYGFGGGLLAAMLLSAVLLLIEAPLGGLLGSYDQRLNFAGFDLTFLVGLLLIGGALGVAGALVAARQRLKNLEIH